MLMKIVAVFKNYYSKKQYADLIYVIFSLIIRKIVEFIYSKN